MTKWTKFDPKTSVNSQQVMRIDREFVITAPEKQEIIANSCCWQSKPPKKDIMPTNMVNTLARKQVGNIPVYNFVKSAEKISRNLYAFAYKNKYVDAG
jgi:hypothetical protein